MNEPSSRASLPSAGDTITLYVTDADGNVAITNRTNYLLNVCRAERNGRRAFIPTMLAGATVTVGPNAFRPTDRAHPGSDLRVNCHVDGADMAAVIR